MKIFFLTADCLDTSSARPHRKRGMPSRFRVVRAAPWIDLNGGDRGRRHPGMPQNLADLGERGPGCQTGWPGCVEAGARQDRKSTRLNSSHVEISYAVFCLKKKKKKK